MVKARRRAFGAYRNKLTRSSTCDLCVYVTQAENRVIALKGSTVFGLLSHLLLQWFFYRAGR
jgi:hypothetical protein